MSTPTDDTKVEISIGGIAMVPAKYVPVIELINKTTPGMFQEVADSWIQMLRLTAAESNMEIDEVLAKILAEAAGEASGEPAVAAP